MVAVGILICSAYANMSYYVTDSTDYRFFPPFLPDYNRNTNDELGAEYYNISKAILADRGFSDPFERPTGATAWTAPVLPACLAVLQWTLKGKTEAVAAAVVFLQLLTLIATGFLILSVIRRSGSNVWVGAVAYAALLLHHFWLSFQLTHDCWIVLLALDLIFGGLIWCQPLDGSYLRAAVWGCFGGLCALVTPVLGFVWGTLVVADSLAHGQLKQAAVAILLATLTITPWIVRNYHVFGKIIPIKSNLAYELYQSQCLVDNGIQSISTCPLHPLNDSIEAREYDHLGEMAYLDRKRVQFSESCRVAPMAFAHRVYNRFLAATLVYCQFTPETEKAAPLILITSYIIHPLPFIAVVLLLINPRKLTNVESVIIGIYGLYLLPYVAISYYERYVFPLVGLQTVLITRAVDRIGQWTSKFRHARIRKWLQRHVRD
jgi:hypothetical protein